MIEEPIKGIIEQLYTTEGQMIFGDTYKTLRLFEDKKFDLVITSPPYNIGKEYETKTIY